MVAGATEVRCRGAASNTVKQALHESSVAPGGVVPRNGSAGPFVIVTSYAPGLAGPSSKPVPSSVRSIVTVGCLLGLSLSVKVVIVSPSPPLAPLRWNTTRDIGFIRSCVVSVTVRLLLLFTPNAGDSFVMAPADADGASATPIENAATPHTEMAAMRRRRARFMVPPGVAA